MLVRGGCPSLWPAQLVGVACFKSGQLCKKEKALKRVSQVLWRPALSLVSSPRKKAVIEETASDLWRLITYSGCLVILRLLLTSSVNGSAPT
ncbi:hypothetical protein LEMLEM_LOCUS17709 [Lemmus lemmus]